MWSILVAVVTFCLSSNINLRIAKFKLKQIKSALFNEFYEPNVDFNITWGHEDPIEKELNRLQKKSVKIAYAIALLIAVAVGIMTFIFFPPS